MFFGLIYERDESVETLAYLGADWYEIRDAIISKALCPVRISDVTFSTVAYANKALWLTCASGFQ